MTGVQDPVGEVRALVAVLRRHFGADLATIDADGIAALQAELRRVTSWGGAEGAEARWQDACIAEAIPPRVSVLDLGCGAGDLLAGLMAQKDVRGQGVELNQDQVVACVAQGVPVLQADIDEGLKGFSDKSFDYVVLEETLQTLHRPLTVLEEMLRVGTVGIVTFPNFASWRVRLDLLVSGRMPTTSRLPHEWHSTPNIHHLTIADFLDWCPANDVEVVDGRVLVDGDVRPYQDGDNLLATEALFFIRRNSG